ncbi:MAG: AAA family ATPase [Candidatus Aminicenantes bacterium]|nr:AAA family ATPase [Candidatus Aminicenantes bacterium]NIM81871.1 AAA family ATPase [Candidatus Aminicenantes bacterium]NIN21248.1 AAA family ATPase [Candidatus Aminicenantes bacterium]NIN45069.1 AAA family ATPase [Candidatus Aminicenantes bacterium]NIN87886.1 AAA family ATPase [Candidatus Aminicenantes bacterium]
MRRFHSYGPINNKLHYYAPREELLNRAYTQLLGENPSEGGHYITVWAPRQTGKTWVMQQILFRLKKENKFDVLKINLESLKDKKEPGDIINTIARKIGEGLNKTFKGIDNQDKFQEMFKKGVLDKPLILILDEFDALIEEGINALVGAFRNIYIQRMDEMNKPTGQKTYLLHGAVLIGVRSVLGFESQTGSPFNVQRSLHVPNLTYEEVEGMFQWYQKESGQEIEPEVIKKLYEETRGQPGLTCWLGELLTEGIENYPNDITKPIRMADFENIYGLAINLLPNNNILNIISKVGKDPYRETVLTLFNPAKPFKFHFDKKEINFLYMNGVIEPEIIPGDTSYIRFASPLVQKRLFNYFSGEIFSEMGQLVDSFFHVKEVISPDHIDIPMVLQLYQAYLDKNKTWLFKNAPRRSDMRVYEAVYHFNLYTYLDELLRGKGVRVYPEFPTGNGKIDLIIRYKNITYGIELKSFTDQAGYYESLERAARYGNQLQLRDIYLVSFVESMDEASKKKYETVYRDPQANVTVHPIFLQTGSP